MVAHTHTHYYIMWLTERKPYIRTHYRNKVYHIWRLHFFVDGRTFTSFMFAWSCKHCIVNSLVFLKSWPHASAAVYVSHNSTLVSFFRKWRLSWTFPWHISPVALVAAWESVVMLAVAPTNPARTLILLLVFSLTLTGATMASAVLPFNYFTALRPCADETKPKSKSVAWRFSNWNWPTGFHKLVFFVLHVIVWFFN